MDGKKWHEGKTDAELAELGRAHGLNAGKMRIQAELGMLQMNARDTTPVSEETLHEYARRTHTRYRGLDENGTGVFALDGVRGLAFVVTLGLSEVLIDWTRK
jgi:hypothetical protein